MRRISGLQLCKPWISHFSSSYLLPIKSPINPNPNRNLSSLQQFPKVTDPLEQPDTKEEISLLISRLENNLHGALTRKQIPYTGASDEYHLNSVDKTFTAVLDELRKARRARADDERMAPIVTRVKELGAVVKVLFDGHQIRRSGDRILGLLLRLQDAESREEEVEWNFNDSCRIPNTISEYKKCWIGHVPRILKDSLSHGTDHDMMLMRWMDLQVELLKEDAKDLVDELTEGVPSKLSSTPQNFLPISTLLSHFDKLLEERSGVSTHHSPLTDTKEDIDMLISNMILKIAMVRDGMYLTFTSASRRGENKNTECVVNIRKATKEVAEAFYDLFAKVPMESYFDVTLGEWLEQYLKPKVDDLISQVPIRSIKLLSELDEDMSALEYHLDAAVTYKHTDHSGMDYKRCDNIFQYGVLREIKKARSVVPANDEHMLQFESRFNDLEAEMETCLNESRIRKVSNAILGLVLKIDEDKGEFEYLYPARHTICEYKGCRLEHMHSIFEESLSHFENTEMSLMKWMAIQAQMLKEDVKDLKTYCNEGFHQMHKRKPPRPRNFLKTSTLLSHYAKLFENRTDKLTGGGQAQLTDVLAAGKSIFNMVCTIAKARERLSIAFEALYPMTSMNTSLNKKEYCISHAIAEEMTKTSECWMIYWQRSHRTTLT